MHRATLAIYGLYGLIYLTPTATIATVNTGFVCFHRFLKTFPNINRIIKLLLQRNFAAKIKYIYLISSQNIKSKYF